MHLSVESDPRELLSYETSKQRELRPGPSCSKVG